MTEKELLESVIEKLNKAETPEAIREALAPLSNEQRGRFGLV